MSERRLRVAIAALSVIGLAISIYLTVERVRGVAPSCPIGGSCVTVQTSEYAELAGVPVPVTGIVGYAGLLVAALLSGPLGRLLGLLVALVAFGFSVWLTYVELFVIDAICTWCVTSATIVTVITVLAIWRALLPTGGVQAPPSARSAAGG